MKYKIISYIIPNFKIKIIIEIKAFLFLIFLILKSYSLKRNKIIKIALCTTAKKENLYVKEFINYYLKLGIDHIYIYDDNDPNTEKISDVIDYSYKTNVTIYLNKNEKIEYQSQAYNHCYKNNNNKFDWILFIDMDEFLFIKNYKLKNFLNKSIFNKCSFINFHWVLPSDNNLLYYDNRTLFERFKKPYIKSIYIKSIIRGNIPLLKYMVHSPYESPIKNITCNSRGKIIKYKSMNIEYYNNICLKQGYIIHFKYKSTEEYINKLKRGYTFFSKDKLNIVLKNKIEEYLNDNKITLAKIKYFEKELKLNLSKYKINLK
jgi:hypothetical protein